MIRSSVPALGLGVFAIALQACAGAPNGEEPSAQDGALSSSKMVGDFHLATRTLDEAFLFDGAVSELSISEDGGRCHYNALQARGGCDAHTSCTDVDLLSSDKHRARIDGGCTVTSTELTLETPEGNLAFKVEPATAHGKTGLLLTSTSGKQLNRAGASAFFQPTSRDPGEALSRCYDGGADDALTKDIKSSDSSLPPAVRAGLAKLEAELSEPVDDITREVTGTFAVFATPFDSEPVAYAVESTNSGDHCGGYQVFAVDTSGKRIKTELSDGDCGL
jgi:hypothetical protein